jgi:hypothetical protein
MKPLIATLLSVAALIAAPTSRADQPDPHTPNGAALWCQGGMGNVAMIPYCDGLRYPDGSFWHQTAASPFGFGGPAGLPWNAPVLVPA